MSEQNNQPQEVIERQRVRILELLKVLECVAGMPCICQEGDDGFPAGFHVRSCVVGVAQKLLGRTQDER